MHVKTGMANLTSFSQLLAIQVKHTIFSSGLVLNFAFCLIYISYDYIVGLGAVWRFPYYCFKNGGGAFLIPFAIFMVLIGLPLMYLELAVGQFTSRGPVLSWVMTPLFKGTFTCQFFISK
jgi:hypothetical protein